MSAAPRALPEEAPSLSPAVKNRSNAVPHNLRETHRRHAQVSPTNTLLKIFRALFTLLRTHPPTSPIFGHCSLLRCPPIMGLFKKLFKKEEVAPAAVDDTAAVEDVAAEAAQCGDGTSFCAELLPGCPPNMPFQISCYGRRLQANKAALAEACAAAGVSPELHALFVAMAMIETNHMCPTERDDTKDCNTDGSANVSIFNLSVDLVQCAGFEGSPCSLNEDLVSAVQALAGAIDKWGVMATLDFVRGGRTGFNDHVSYGCADYRRTVATVLQQIDRDPALLADDRRVEVELVHV